MKTKSLFLTVLLCIVPMLLFAQNYEKKGDELFQQAKYGEALKQYNAAVEFSGEGSSLLNKQKKAENCKIWLEQAIKAENSSKFAEASRLYKKLYDAHPLEKYNSKAQSLGAKAEQQAKDAEQQRINKWYEQGLQYFNEDNVRDAAEYLLKAAEKGHAGAQYYYAELYGYDNYYGNRIYYSEAIDWFEKAANQGHAAAQYKLGYCYEKGYGVHENSKTALIWYQKAAEQDNREALEKLAIDCYNGHFRGGDHAPVYWYEKGAKLGIMTAQYLLAGYYYNKKNNKEALNLYKQAKDAAAMAYYENNKGWPNTRTKDIYADSEEKVKELDAIITKQNNVKEWLEKGNEYFNKKMFSDAIIWYEKLIHVESTPELYYKSGYCYERINDYHTAVQRYQQAATKGDKEAQYRLGLCTEQGKGIKANNDQAIQWYRKAADQGHTEAKTNLNRLIQLQQKITDITNWKTLGAKMYVAKSYSQAIQWYKKAADAGDTESVYWVGECYFMLTQYTQAIEWYNKAAEQKNINAQYRLGYCYENAKGTSQNYSEAVKWYAKAAEQGHADAQLRLANCYASGQGVTQDNVTAVQWYQKAANNGNAEAQYYVGDCYSKGIGLKKSPTEAANYYKKAAAQNHIKAQYKIANYYNKGIGVSIDKSAAYNWYSQAACNGHAGAKMIVAQKDYFSENGKLELTWFGTNVSAGTGYEISISALRLRYLWFQLNLLDFTLGDTFINKDSYSEPFLFYQPSFNILVPVYENGAAYLGIGPSWDANSELDCQLKVEAGFRFNYGRCSSSDLFLRYDGTAFTIGASIQWSSRFMKNSK